MKRKMPLWQRLYVDPVYTEVARAIGYRRFRQAEAESRLAPLLNQFGKERVAAASRELLTLVFKGEYKRSGCQRDAEVCLTEEARNLCFQLLGPAPEHPAFKAFYPAGKPDQAKDATPKKRRKRS
jgi:hypothetical protein